MAVFETFMTHKDAVFSGDGLDGQHHVDSRFLHCSFPDATLKFATFRRCRFVGCDFSSVSYDGTGFSDCSFPESKLSDLNLFHVGFTDCDFSGAVLRNCVFQRLTADKRSPAKKFDLSSCVFEGTDLSGTVFFLCDLSGVNFRRATLERATFDRCVLKKADFVGAAMDGIRFIDCKIEKTILDLQGFIRYGQSNGFISEP